MPATAGVLFLFSQDAPPVASAAVAGTTRTSQAAPDNTLRATLPRRWLATTFRPWVPTATSPTARLRDALHRVLAGSPCTTVAVVRFGNRPFSPYATTIFSRAASILAMRYRLISACDVPASHIAVRTAAGSPWHAKIPDRPMAPGARPMPQPPPHARKSPPRRQRADRGPQEPTGPPAQGTPRT